MLVLKDYQDLAKRRVLPEQEIVTRHFAYFGPVPPGLYEQVDEDWRDALRTSAKQAERVVEDHPEVRFEQWAEGLSPEGRDMISGMTNLDPSARTTIDQVLTHPWWQEELERCE